MAEDDGNNNKAAEGAEPDISSTADTQRMDNNKDANVSTGADKQEDAGGGVDAAAPVSAPQAAQIEPKEQEAPFDEENAVVNVGHGDDDVSSLQHTNMEPKQLEVQETANVNVDDGVEYYDEAEAEQQKALQRRNLLIIIMLLLFLGLVVAIGVGVGLAVKNAPPSSANDDTDETIPSIGANETTDDDEYGGLGGGLDEDDAFKTLAPSEAPSNAGPCIPVELGIIFDEYSGETGWFLVKDDYDPEDASGNEIVWKSKYYNPLEYDGRADTFHECFSPGRYTFVFTDKEGDGICCYHGEGSYVLTAEGKVITIGGEMNSKEESVAFELPFVEPEPVDANGDGMDDRLGLIMPYDLTNKDLVEGVDCENFRLVILTDRYGIETTWELYEGIDKSGTLIANGGPYASEYTYVVDYCLASPKQYVLYMYDWDRRGLCCASGEGWYRVNSGDVVLRDSDGQFGEVNITKFALPADGTLVLTDEPTPGPTVLGLIIGAKKTQYPTPAPVKSDRVDTTTMDKEVTPFPTITPNEPIL